MVATVLTKVVAVSTKLLVVPTQAQEELAVSSKQVQLASQQK